VIASRYWHTVRYLRPIQIAARLRLRIGKSRPDLRPAPGLRRPVKAWSSPRWRAPVLQSATTAVFLNQSRDIAAPAAWNDPDYERLWLYNLHYFDDLHARDAQTRRPWHRHLIDRWLRENPPGVGPGWEPYTLSLRIANWAKVLWGDDDGRATLSDAAIESLAVQVRWLSNHLEHHIQANHLWTNAKALLMAGVVFDGPEAELWRNKGLALMLRELKEQILADGGHYERSPMYHAIVLEDVLDIIELGRCAPALLQEHDEQLRDVAARMSRWLRVMCHPDGDVGFFNDAAFGIAPRLEVLVGYAHALGITIDDRPMKPVEALPESGYVRLANERAVVLCDLAAVGPDHQPGHAHADTLSFELSIDGRRAVVNGGTSTYTPGASRVEQRSTHGHNTVEVDRQDSSEVWGAFRVARRARPFAVAWGVDAGGPWATGSHDGYRRLPGRVIHRRRWQLLPGSLHVVDHLAGRFETARANFLLAPDVCLGGSGIKFVTIPPIPLSAAPAYWYPEFGQSVETQRVSASFDLPKLTTVIQWQ